MPLISMKERIRQIVQRRDGIIGRVLAGLVIRYGRVGNIPTTFIQLAGAGSIEPLTHDTILILYLF